MSGRLWGGRRAEAFQNALDGHVDLTEYELAEFVRLAHTLRDMPPATLGNEARSAMRARLVAEAETVLGGQTVPPPAVRRRPRRRGVRVAVGSTAAVAALSAGLVSMSADALPGDLLYPIKRGVEQVELTVGGGGAAGTGHTRLDHASERLTEAEQLAQAGEVDRVADVLDDFSSDAEIGAEQLLRAYAADGDRVNIEEIRTFASASADRLQAIAPMLGESASASYETAVGTITEVDRRAVAACPECAGGPGVQVPYEPNPVDSLPQLDDHGNTQGNQESNDDIIAQPDDVPHGTDLPPIEQHPDDNGDTDGGGHNDGDTNENNDGDNGDSDQSPTLQGDSTTGSDSSNYTRPDSGGSSNDTLPDLPRLPKIDKESGSVVDSLPLGPADDVLDPVQDLLDQLGPIGDILEPVLGDGEEAGADEPNGPISGLLDTLLNGGPKDDAADADDQVENGDSDGPNQSAPNQGDEDQADDNEPADKDQSGDDQDGDGKPDQDLIDKVEESDDAPPVDQDQLDDMTDGATDGATAD